MRPNLNLDRNFNAFETSSWISYRFPSKANLFARYSASNNIPSVSQIQPFVNEVNPLNIVTGNPNLKPTNNHRYSISYNKYNFQQRTGMYFNASFTKEQNKIVSKSIIDPVSLVRNTTYENVNGYYTASLGGNYSKKMKLDSINTINLSIGAYSYTSKNISFFNGIKTNALTKSFSPNLRATIVFKNIIQIAPYYSISFSNTSYDSTNFEDQKFSTHNLRINTKTLYSKKFEWSNNIRYNYNPNIADGFQKSAWFWNSSIAYSILKNKGTITLKAYDLLNQNTNARRVATANYIEDRQSSVLQQYFMLSFSWKFNSLGKKGETRENPFFIF